jgi:hypothetical protein
MFSLSEMIERDKERESNKEHEVNPLLSNPPRGAWVKKGFGKLTIGISAFSKKAFFYIPFCAAFSTISFTLFLGTLISDNISVRLLIFSLPFIIGSCMLIKLTMFETFGKIEIVFGEDTFIFVGVGNIGKKTHLDWEKVTNIAKSFSTHRDNDGDSFVKKEILIEGSNFAKMPIDDKNSAKERFLYLVLKDCCGKKIDDIVN